LEKIPIKRQTYIKGARVLEFERDIPFAEETKVFRIDAGEKFVDVAKGSPEGFRVVELITGKRWRFGKPEPPVELTDKTKTLARVREVEITKRTGRVDVVERGGIGKAELISRIAEDITESPKNLRDVSRILTKADTGKIPNVEAEVFTGKNILKEVAEALNVKEVAVDADALKELNKRFERGFTAESNARYFIKNSEGEIIPKLDYRQVRIQEILFEPELTRKLISAETKNRVIKFEGGKVAKPEDLIPEEKIVAKRTIDRVKEFLFGEGKAKEVEMKSEKDMANERLKSKEYRKELLQTLRDIYGETKKEFKGSRRKAETKSGLLLEELEEELQKATEDVLKDYPVIKEESLKDVLNFDEAECTKVMSSLGILKSIREFNPTTITFNPAKLTFNPTRQKSVSSTKQKQEDVTTTINDLMEGIDESMKELENTMLRVGEESIVDQAVREFLEPFTDLVPKSAPKQEPMLIQRSTPVPTPPPTSPQPLPIFVPKLPKFKIPKWFSGASDDFDFWWETFGYSEITHKWPTAYEILFGKKGGLL